MNWKVRSSPLGRSEFSSQATGATWIANEVRHLKRVQVITEMAVRFGVLGVGISQVVPYELGCLSVTTRNGVR